MKKDYEMKVTITTKSKWKCFFYFGHTWEKIKVSEDDSVYYYKCNKCNSVKAVKWDNTESSIDMDYIKDMLKKYE